MIDRDLIDVAVVKLSGLGTFVIGDGLGILELVPVMLSALSVLTSSGERLRGDGLTGM